MSGAEASAGLAHAAAVCFWLSPYAHVPSAAATLRLLSLSAKRVRSVSRSEPLPSRSKKSRGQAKSALSGAASDSEGSDVSEESLFRVRGQELARAHERAQRDKHEAVTLLSVEQAYGSRYGAGLIKEICAALGLVHDADSISLLAAKEQAQTLAAERLLQGTRAAGDEEDLVLGGLEDVWQKKNVDGLRSSYARQAEESAEVVLRLRELQRTIVDEVNELEEAGTTHRAVVALNRRREDLVKEAALLREDMTPFNWVMRPVTQAVVTNVPQVASKLVEEPDPNRCFRAHSAFLRVANALPKAC